MKDASTKFTVFKNRPGLLTAKKIEVKAIVSDDLSESETKTTAQSSYRIWKHKSYEGEGRDSIQGSLEDCLKACDEDNDCIHITFDGRRCRIHKDLEKGFKRVKAIGNTAIMRTRMVHTPDALVKHHWTKGGQQQTENAVFQTWQNCQFKGADITAVKVKTLQDCLMECDAEMYCHHITLIGSECMLKGWSPQYFEIVPGKADMWAAKKIENKRKEAKVNVLHTGLPAQDNELADLHQDFLVGEYYDESTAHDTKFSRYRIWEGFTFRGGELQSSNLQLPAYTIESCLEACDHTPGCSFAVVILGKECWPQGRPYDLSRTIEHRNDVYAAMKLGRADKRGIDALTTHKVDRRSRPWVDPSYAYAIAIDIPTPPGWTLWSVMWYAFVIAGLVWVVKYVAAMWSSQNRPGFYANELA